MVRQDSDRSGARASGAGGDGGAPPAGGCLAGIKGLILLPFYMLKLLFVLPKMVFLIPKIMLRSVSSQTNVAVGAASLPSGMAELRPPQPAAERDAACAAIAGHDAAFAPHDVAQRVGWVRDVVEHSVVHVDPASARLVMSDGLWATHRMLLSMRADHEVERRAQVVVTGAEVVEAYHSPLVDEVRVRLTCEGTCFDRHRPTGLVVRGTELPTRWTEDLTVTRSARSTTPAGGGLLACSCPNCGAPLQVTDDGSCTTCKALVMSGERDWVLTEQVRSPW